MTGSRSVPVVPALAALATGLWGLTGPSFWRDEAVTAEVSRRALPQILRLLSEVDAVHGLYYLLLHLVSGALGSGEAALRLPSVLAGMVTAAGTAELGRRYAGPRAGLLAGLLAACSPFLTRYAQDARPYALVTATAVVATLLLSLALERGGRGRWAAYAASVVLLGLFNLFALLLLPAHAVMARPARRPWTLSALSALLCLTPLLALASTQRGTQLSWLDPPDPGDLMELAGLLAGGTWLIAPFTALAALGACRRPPLRPLALPWLLLPPALLLCASLASPVYTPRYVLFTAPAAALLVAAGLDSLPTTLHRTRAALLRAGIAFPRAEAAALPQVRAALLRTKTVLPRVGIAFPRAGAAALSRVRAALPRTKTALSWVGTTLHRASRAGAVLPWVGAVGLVAGMVPLQVKQHAVDDRADDLRRLRVIVKLHESPGDGLLFRVSEQRTVMGAYPGTFAGLDDLALERDGAEAGNLAGVLADPAEFSRRLARVERVWLISKAPDRRAPSYTEDEARVAILRASFTKVRGWRFKGGYAALYRRG